MLKSTFLCCELVALGNFFRLLAPQITEHGNGSDLQHKHWRWMSHNTDSDNNQTWKVVLEVPPRNEFAALAMDACWSVTAGLGLDDRYRRNLQQALREVFSGAVRRAVPPAHTLPLQICFRVSSDCFEVKVHEHGMPYGDDGNLDSSLLSIQKLVDSVVVSNLGREGTETGIVMSLQRKMVEHYLSKKEWNEAILDRAGGQGPARKNEPFHVRTMHSSEAVEVCRCAFLSYGYSYLHDAIYYPERIRKLNKSGSIFSIVAVSSQTEEIMGHAALKKDSNGDFAELVMAFVKPEFRGNGCLENLTQSLIQLARNNQFGGAYLCSVTSHVYSQKVASRHNFSECALYLSRLAPMNFQGLPDAKAHRESLLSCYQMFSTPKNSELYIPEKHTKMVRELFEGIGINVRSAPFMGYAELEKTELEIETDSQQTGLIRVCRFGGNVKSDVNRALRSLCIRRMEVIYLLLPLHVPATAHFFSDFEQMHFFFSGVVPSMDGKHNIVLQFLNNQVVDYDEIRMETELGLRLREYVKSQDPFRDFVSASNGGDSHE